MARKIAVGVIIISIGGAWVFATTRASENDLEKVEQQAADASDEAETAHRRIDRMAINQAVVIVTIDGIAQQVGAPGVPEKVLRSAARVAEESRVTR